MPNKDGTGPKQGGCCGGHGHHGDIAAEHKQGGCCGGYGKGEGHAGHHGEGKGCCGK
ncbi:hypothetical protein QE109_15330 [Fusibacter bizertensis]|uniref:Uncharacterized protein n=1 Tax=Fusibacter bizertensis TaxID=1488331 RepID=A0ABT6NGG8_9FIRM|nr:hypothetical protein [Fusibacter bizertensis]MDH8679530.1 hypothetical protein [Fusibacter bizertensis]